MLRFHKTFRFLNATMRNQIIPRASITEKPPKEIITPMDQAIALTVMFATFLVPSGWVLSHIEHYRSAPRD